ncbi:MAG: PD-(D/E)XK motif protein [Bacilli bacterium]
MSINILENLDDSTERPDVFHRVDGEHLLDLYIGFDIYSRKTLLLISDIKPTELLSSPIIEIDIGERNDKKWAISFTLINKEYLELFCHFCDDIIESSRKVKEKGYGTIFICNRYLKWQNMLKKKRTDLLEFSEIKGLIGELIFLKNSMFESLGQKKAILSWIGPKNADQDFVFGDKWYEVKTTVSGSNIVKISSVEQLDTNSKGYLIVIYLDKTSEEDNHRITLNSLVNEILNMIDDEYLINVFENLLFDQGYIHREEYDEYSFKLSKVDKYIVTSEFPCLRFASLPNSVTSIKYELFLDKIEKFKGEIEK